MDFLLLPSYREGFPNVVLEASSAGRPTIGFRSTGVRDPIIDGETGQIVPVGDATALAEEMATFLSIPSSQPVPPPPRVKRIESSSNPFALLGHRERLPPERFDQSRAARRGPYTSSRCYTAGQQTIPKGKSLEKKAASLVVSLDFELYWGVLDHTPLDRYAARLRRVHEAVPRMLDLFAEHGVGATWATVGFVLLEGFDELADRQPNLLPGYRNPAFCPYAYSERPASSEARLHFAPELVKQILATPGQELGTHTFSHFYCLEEPRSLDAFRADLEASIGLAREKHGIVTESLVFPRNQYSPEHARIAGELGIRAIRGNPDQWMYRPRSSTEGSRLARGARLADAYLPVAGKLLHPKPDPGYPVDVKASRFLRPWSRRLRHLEPLKNRRIASEMEKAAKNGNMYHLWWHPHNFGADLEENLAGLKEILQTFTRLRDCHGMESFTMAEVARRAQKRASQAA